MKKQKLYLLVLFGLMGLFFAFAVFAWQNPSAAPPGGNLTAPLNVSATSQTKTGGLYILGNTSIGITGDQGYRLYLRDASPTGGTFRITNSGNTEAIELGTAASELVYLSSGSGDSILFRPAGSDRLRLWASGGLSFGSGYSGNDPGVGNAIFQGNVGIGTTAPGAKLEVAGTAKIVDGTQGSGKVLTSDAAGLASWQTSGGGVPSGAVMFFNLATCPTGWFEQTAVRGRYIVGLPLGGTLGGTAGTALSNLENRPVGQHSHTFNASFSSGQHGPSPAGVITDNVYTNSTQATGAVAGTNAPYTQLLACQKS